MSHYLIRQDLSKLKHAVKKIKLDDGRETTVVILDGPSNNLFFGEKGGIYLDMIAFENKEIKYENTHSIKQSLPKDVRDKMSEDDIRNMPFLGNMKPTGGNGGGAPNDAPRAESFDGISFDNDSGSASKSDPVDDLPF